jgi:hypothetical protein
LEQLGQLGQLGQLEQLGQPLEQSQSVEQVYQAQPVGQPGGGLGLLVFLPPFLPHIDLDDLILYDRINRYCYHE